MHKSARIFYGRIPLGDPDRPTNLGSQRAENLAQIEDIDANLRSANERLTELHRYKADLAEELDRITRAEDAGAVLSDLKVTHCPACDQSVSQLHSHANACFLCHQDLPSAISNGELGAVRIRFERDRLSAELKEAEELSSVLTGEANALSKQLIALRDSLQKVENELAPARQAVAALVQDEVSAVDMALGEAHERQTHLSRITEVLKVGETMTEEIKAIEKEIEPIQEKVNLGKRAIDFDERAAALEEGMNAYFNAINALRPNVWRHSPARVDVSSSGFKIRVGTRTWSAVLGGTDTLYFLMAYHYGLLSLSRMEGFHYPGLSIIDVPGEFSGEAVEDKENFIVQPFIDLLRRKEYEGAQLIISGASFAGLEGASRRALSDVHVA